MIVAMQNLIPDRRAVSAEKNSIPAPPDPQIYAAACPPRPAVGRGGQQATTTDPQPSPAPAQREDLAEVRASRTHRRPLRTTTGFEDREDHRNLSTSAVGSNRGFLLIAYYANR
jgi:hypothetical protein